MCHKTLFSLAFLSIVHKYEDHSQLPHCTKQEIGIWRLCLSRRTNCHHHSAGILQATGVMVAEPFPYRAGAQGSGDRTVWSPRPSTRKVPTLSGSFQTVLCAPAPGAHGAVHGCIRESASSAHPASPASRLPWATDTGFEEAPRATHTMALKAAVAASRGAWRRWPDSSAPWPP